MKVSQIRNMVKIVDERMKQGQDDMQVTENERNEALREIGNLVHSSVPVSNDEVSEI